jgi:hypothetical protein
MRILSHKHEYSLLTANVQTVALSAVHNFYISVWLQMKHHLAPCVLPCWHFSY